MKRFQSVCRLVFFCVVGVFVVANLFLLFGQKKGSGRPYRVEISRLARQMEEGKSAEAPDLSWCNYVTAVVKETGEGSVFYEANSDYVLREINGALYRFEYTANAKENRMGQIVLVNGLLGIMTVLVFCVLVYLRQKILLPFEKMESVPYELSKGNLTAPLAESKSRFFGKFVWGVNMLRENIEQQKERELSLQKEKKTLLLSLSHDIKTPLSAIKLYAKALSKGLYSDTEKQTEIAGNIDAKADEIEGFVSEIIRASSEDFLTFEFYMGEFYLKELLEEITAYYSEKLKLIHTGFWVEAYSDSLLKGDKDRAVEVLQNFLENAIKYGDGKQITLSVTEEEGYKLISVTNTGCTLSETELPHVFESFWRGSNAGTQKGSGLGLYISRQLMRKMGGEVFAKAENNNMTVTAVFPEA